MWRVIGWLPSVRGPLNLMWHGRLLRFAGISTPATVGSFDRDRAVTPSTATVRHGAKVALRLAGQCFLLCLFFGAGTALAEAFSLILPGNLIGLLLLLLCLRTGVLRPAHVQDVASLVTKHLNFFFIPLVVGLMAWTGLLAASGLVLALSLVGSAVVGIGIAGLIAQWIGRTGGRNHVG